MCDIFKMPSSDIPKWNMYLKLYMRFLGSVCSFSDSLFKTCREGCSAPHILFRMDTSPEQAALWVQWDLGALSESRQCCTCLGSPSSVLCTWSCCNFGSGFSSNKGLRLHVFHNFFSCKTSYPCASVVVFSTAAVRQVWSTQMDKGVCTTTEGAQRAAALWCSWAHPHDLRLDKGLCIYQQITWNP